jgi:transcriptional antiterminator NusG
MSEEKKWYSLRVISGKEKKIKERIDLEIQRNEWNSFITQVIVPIEKVYKIRSGKKVISERNILPGYILIEADPAKLSGEVVQVISNVPNVIHFLGKNTPVPMLQSEANRLLGKVDESQDAGEQMLEPYLVGETVKITDGPFTDFIGEVQEINEEKKKLKVIVKIFGRGTEVELNFIQVEKTQ